MARKPKPQAPEVQSDANIEVIESAGNTMNAMAINNTETAEAAHAMATQLEYDGQLSVENLEGEIRFYQRQTMAACLELGKRLLILKELTPHGEFEEKLGSLDFSYRTAARFMQAAAKTAKSANLAVLSGRVKNMSAFLELVTHDDEVLESLKDLDDIDRMSASQLRAALRDAKEDAKAKEEVLSKKSDIINKLQTERTKAQQRIARETPDETIAALRQDATVIANEVLGMVRGNFRHALQTVSEESDDHLFLAGLVGEVAVTLAMLREEFNLPDVSDARELELIRETAKWAPNAQTSAESTQDPEDAVVEAQE